MRGTVAVVVVHAFFCLVASVAKAQDEDQTYTLRLPILGNLFRAELINDFLDNKPEGIQAIMGFDNGSYFDVPTIDPAKMRLDDISFSVLVQMGGSAWSAAPNISSLQNGLWIDRTTLNDAQIFTSDPSTSIGRTFSYDSDTEFSAAANPDFVGSPDGHIQLGAFFVIAATGIFNNSGLGSPGAFVWITDPVLTVTYSFKPITDDYLSALPIQSYVLPPTVHTLLNPNSVGPIPSGTVPTYITDAPGDVNNDRIVNAQDIAIITSNWLVTSHDASGDLNRDGIVNAQDLAMVSSNWLGVPVVPINVITNASAVPEPSTLILAAIGGLALLAVAKRSASQ
jgi:hypothetical protein